MLFSSRRRGFCKLVPARSLARWLGGYGRFARRRAAARWRPSCACSGGGAGYASFIDIGDCGVTDGTDDALARQPLGVAVGLDKLNKGCAFDKFGAEIHRRTPWHEEKKKNKGGAYELGTTSEMALLVINDLRHYRGQNDLFFGRFYQISPLRKKLGLIVLYYYSQKVV